jgi:hypothetical protein
MKMMKMMNKYPIYVISKGRPNSITVRVLNEMRVPHFLVVEPSEYDQYKGSTENILILPSDFSKLGQGSIPVRNWVWEHSLSNGDKRHWIMDDNIESFHRLNRNTRYRVKSGAIFKCVEDFTDRYENVAMSGLNYFTFANKSCKLPPYYLNTRIYSCILINNDIEHRWRGRFNEDTDLSLRVLKDGWCTILFNAFLAAKVTTLRMKGGNTDTIYNTTNKRREFAESLAKQHPDVAKVTWKFNRWHHQVNYKPFKVNKLIKKKDIIINEGINEYGLKLIDVI